MVRTVMRCVVAAMLFSAALPHAAGAVTFIAPSTSVLDAQSNATAISAGGTYVSSGTFVQPGASFDDYFAFTATSPLSVTMTASALEADPVANGPFGVTGLTGEWLGSGISATFTDPNGVLDATVRLVATLTSDSMYILHVFGTGLADGGEFSLRLTATDAPSSVPLPPAIVLLGTILGGMAVAQLRRRGSARA